MDLHPKQFARLNVRALKSEGSERAVDRNFSVDPRTITLDRLRHLLARALHIRHEFSLIFHRTEGDMALSCDWDLEGALAEEPHIDLTLELKPFEPGLEEWDIICDADVPVAGHEASGSPQWRKESFLEQVFHPRTSSCLLTESEFLSVEDWPCPLRFAVYRSGGADPSVRPSLWMHLLDVYPSGAGPKDREEFLNRKAEEYYGLRYSWQRLVQIGTIPEVLRDVTCLVRKDVRRTDRSRDLDEHALYNVLTTYALHHPSVGYVQGMSDLLSPLLHVMKTEALAYSAFCGLMQRMRDNFRRDGRSICTKFRHLQRAVRTHDPRLHDHLSAVGALDLLFCYRWLLLDLKREFPYEEMLRLMEISWSTLRPLDCEKGVELYEIRFPACKLHRHKIDAADLLAFTDDYFGSPGRTKKSTTNEKTDFRHLAVFDGDYFGNRNGVAVSLDDDESSTEEDEASSTEGGIVHYKKWRRRSRHVCKSWHGRDSAEEVRRRLGYSKTVHDIQIEHWLDPEESPNSSVRRRHGSSDSNYGSNFSDEEDDVTPTDNSEGYTSGHDSNQTVTDQSDDSSANSFDSADTYFRGRDASHLLPPPTRLGDGKPFLIFVCLTMILKHRDAILDGNMDANEIGIYFDRLVRKHRLDDVLPEAKRLFVEYLNSGWTDDD